MLRRVFSFLRSPDFFVLVAVVLLTFFSYRPVLQAGFVNWSDDVVFLNNAVLQGLNFERLAEIFSTKISDAYAPLTIFSFSAEQHFLGNNPFFYHLDNLLLHLAMVVLLFILGRQLGLSFIGAGVAILLFGIHPVHVESVAWVSGRVGVLAAVFYVVALISYLRYVDVKGVVFLCVTGLVGLLSLFAGPLALSLPLVLLLLDWYKGRPINRTAILEKLPIFLSVGLAGWFVHGMSLRIAGENFLQEALIWAWMFAFYLRQFVFPFISVPIHRFTEPVSLANLEYLLSVAVLAVIIVGGIRLRRQRWLSFAFLFFFSTIFFLVGSRASSDIDFIAERLMYLPSAGFCFLFGAGFEYLFLNLGKNKNKREWFLVGGAMLFFVTAGCLAATHRLVLVWQDSVSLWNHQLSFYPDEPVALNHLATALSGKDEHRQAAARYREVLKINEERTEVDYSAEEIDSVRKIEYLKNLYNQALALDPDYVLAHYNLGNLLKDIGEFAQAEAAYKNMLRIDPSNTDAYFSLGGLYRDAGQSGQAIAAYEEVLKSNFSDEEIYASVILAYMQAIVQDPGNSELRDRYVQLLWAYEDMVNKHAPQAESFFKLGWLYHESGDVEKAGTFYQKALKLKPAHADTLYNLANLYKDSGETEKAIEFYKKTIAADPRKIAAYLNLGNIFGREGDYEKAKGYYRKAIEVAPDNAKAYFSLAYVESFRGHLSEALEYYKKAIYYDPNYDQAYYQLGNIYININMRQEALASFRDAIRINPRNMEALVNLSVLSFKLQDFESAVKYCEDAMLLGYIPPADYWAALQPYMSVSRPVDSPAE